MAAALILDAHLASGLAAAWADHLARDRRRSPHTVRAYAATAHRLIAFLGGYAGERVTPTTLTALTSADLRAYLADRRNTGLANASVARELSAIRGFLAFVAEREGVEANVPRLRGPRLKPGVP
ncbi:MAG: site-specific integrase, partial [Sphingomonadaceae bacterium]|nr:site-specific integrase [Sphingomonadaceae bacterium]